MHRDRQRDRPSQRRQMGRTGSEEGTLVSVAKLDRGLQSPHTALCCWRRERRNREGTLSE